MSKDSIAFQVIDEPQIQSFTPEGDEIADQNNSEIDSFYDYWSRINMDPQTLLNGPNRTELDKRNEHLAEYSKSLFDLKCEVVVMKSILDAITSNNENNTVGIQGTAYTEKEKFNPDIPLGSSIVDKQLQLQQAYNFLSNSAKELANEVNSTRARYRKIHQIAKKYPIDFYYEKLKGKYIPVIPSYPGSYQSIILDFKGDKENEEVKWRISNNVFFNYNGKSLNLDLDQKYGFCNSRLILQILFDRMKRNLLKVNDDYRVDLSSKSILLNFGNDVYQEISLTDKRNDNNTPCPLFIPYLLTKVYQPFSTPYTDLKLNLRKKSTMDNIRNIVIKKFIKHSFCTILTSNSTDRLVIQINGLGNSMALLSYNQDKMILTNPSNQLLFITININSENAEKQLRKWCDDQLWKLFTEN